MGDSIMATIINADTSDGLKLTSDTSGLIEFQSAGVTKAGVNATGLTGNGSQLTALTSANLTGDLPAISGANLTGLPAGYTDSDALTLFNASGSAPVYACRAWVNFNGTGTVAIRDSGNVSSITDNGTGFYTINYTTAMPDTNYSTIGTIQKQSGAGVLCICSVVQSPVYNTNSTKVATTNASGAFEDMPIVCVSIFR